MAPSVALGAVALLLLAYIWRPAHAAASRGSSTACDGRAQYRPRPAAAEVVGHVDYGVRVDLAAEIEIADGCELNLPIEVPIVSLAIDGSAPATVEEVNCLNGDGTYGVGDYLFLTVKFSDVVYVSGWPTLLLRTGCHEDACRTVEEQHFFCKASRGELAISFNGETVPNIPATASQEILQKALAGFTGVESVAVSYNNSEAQRRLCTEAGNTARVAFRRVASWLGDAGDLPPLSLDYLNAPIDARTGASLGDGERLWFGWKNARESEPTYAEQDLGAAGAITDQEGKACLGERGLSGVELSEVATEAVAGSWPQDGAAVYYNGSGSDTLIFRYVVFESDATEDLDYDATDSLQLGGYGGSIYSIGLYNGASNGYFYGSYVNGSYVNGSYVNGSYVNGSYVNGSYVAGGYVNGSYVPADPEHVPADLTLPPPGNAASYRLGTGGSLGAGRNIRIFTGAPAVVAVTSPDEDRAYGTGEQIRIDVVFDQSVTVSGSPLLLLETGVSDASVPLLWSAGRTLRFVYQVRAGDSNADLDVASASSLDLDGGGIYRLPRGGGGGGGQLLAADVTLPQPGAPGSLSAARHIVVRPTTPNAIDVDAVAPPDGSYGPGETIELNVTFGWSASDLTPVELGGSGAELWLRVGRPVLATIWGALNGSREVVLATGHDLTEEDAGRSLWLANGNGSRYAVTLINITRSGDVTGWIEPPYLGPDVLEGVPTTNLSSNGVGAAIYASGNGTSALTFAYVTQPGDSVGDLEYLGSWALRADAAVRRRGGAAINVTLPLPGTCEPLRGCSLGARRKIILDPTIPAVLNVTTTKPAEHGPYPVGESIDITVTFSRAVALTAGAESVPALAPRLQMASGSFAAYSAALTAAARGSGHGSDGVTDGLTFLYEVQEGDYADPLDYWDATADGEVSALDASANGKGYIRRFATTPMLDADLRLATPGTSGSLATSTGALLAVDTGVARVTTINTTAPDGRYGVGDVIELWVHFSAPVWLNETANNGGGGIPYILLNSGGTAAWQGNSLGNGSAAAAQLFSYRVGEGDQSFLLDVLPGATDLTNTTAVFGNGSCFLDAGTGRRAAISLPRLPAAGALAAGAALSIDTAAPNILRVTSLPVTGTYGVGQDIFIFMELDTAVVVTGSPHLLLDLGDEDAAAVYQPETDNATSAAGNSGSRFNGSRLMTFLYTVGEGDSASDLDYATPRALLLPANTSVLRAATRPSQNASLLLPPNGQPGSLGMNSNIRIDTIVPAVTAVTSGMDPGSYTCTVRTQSIDVCAPEELDSGGFLLRYGTAAATACLPVNATALNASSIEEALTSLEVGLSVTVEETATPAPNCRRFQVDFALPSVGVRPLVSELTSCDTWLCNNGSACTGGGGGDGGGSGVFINQDATYPPPAGVVEVVVEFDRAVAVNATKGNPFLLLRLDNSSSAAAAFANWTTARNLSSSDSADTSGVLVAANYSAGLVQFVDVGVSAARQITRGQFRISYGNATTECIDVAAAQVPYELLLADSYDGYSSGYSGGYSGGASLLARLQGLAAAATPGVKSVTRERRGKGYRFRVEFNAGLPLALALPENPTAGCPVPFDSSFPVEEDVVAIPDVSRISFIYELQPGDVARQLRYSGAAALFLNGGTIRRSATRPLQDADLTLPADGVIHGGSSGGSGGWSASSSVIAVDCGDAPTVLNVTTSSYGGSYGPGERIFFRVQFSAPVVVQGHRLPRLLLTLQESGGSSRGNSPSNKTSSQPAAVAYYYSGHGSDTLAFRYTVRNGDVTASLEPFSAAALGWGGGALRSAARAQIVDANLSLAAIWPAADASADAQAVMIDGSTLTQVSAVWTAKSAGSYGVGEEIVLHVEFSEAVEVCGELFLPLNSGGFGVYTQSGVTQVVDVIPDDDADRANGRVTVERGAFRLSWDGSSTTCIPVGNAAAAKAALEALPGLDGSGEFSIANVTVTPRLGGNRLTISFSGGGDGPYERYPSAIAVPWNWDEGCNPLLPAGGTVPRRAATETLAFLYTVAEGENAEPLDVTAETARGYSGGYTNNNGSLLLSEGGWVRRSQSAAVAAVNLTLPAAPLAAAGADVSIDTTRPTVTNLTSLSGDGPFGFGDAVVLRILFSLPVQVVLSGEDYPDGPLLALVVRTTTSARIITETLEDAFYLPAGENFDAAVNSSDAGAVAVAAAVAAAGSAAANDSATDREILLAYIIGADDAASDLDYAAVTSLRGDVRRASSHPTAMANLRLPPPGANGSLAACADVAVTAASEPARVSSVTSQPAGDGTILRTWDVAVITIHFSRPVRWMDDAPPDLALVLGGIREPFLVSCAAPGAGELASSLVFRYEVQPLQRSSNLRYDGPHALAAGGAAAQNGTATAPSLEDAAGAAANTTLPSPNSLLALGGLVVETACRVDYVTVLNDDGVYYAGETIYVAVHYTDPVQVRGVPLVALRAGDPREGYARRAVYARGNASDTLIFEYIVQPGDHTIDLDYDGIGAESVPTQREAGNGATVVSADLPRWRANQNLPAVWTPGTIGARKDIEIQTQTPTVLRVWTTAANGTYGLGDSIDISVTFDTRIYVKRTRSLPYLLVNAGNDSSETLGSSTFGSFGRAAELYSGNMTDTLVFRYVVAAGDSTERLDYSDTRMTPRQRFSTALVRPPVAEIKAASSAPVTDAALFLPLPGARGSLSYATSIEINTEAPYVVSVCGGSSDGVYGAGEDIILLVAFSAPVTLVGADVAPSLLLGMPRVRDERRAEYVSGNNSIELKLKYTVQPGDFSDLLDYEDTDSLSVYSGWLAALQDSGARILRAAMVPSQEADLSLAPPGPLAWGSQRQKSIVGCGSAICVQTDNIRAVSVTSPVPNGSYPLGAVIPLTVTFSVPVILKFAEGGDGDYDDLYGMSSDGDAATASVGDLLWLELALDGNTTARANYSSGNGSDTLTLVYVVENGQTTNDLDYVAGGLQAIPGALTAAETGEPVRLRSLPAPGAPGSLGANKDIQISADALLVEGIWTDTPDGTYGVAERIDIYVSFLFRVAWAGTPGNLSLAVGVNGSGVAVPYLRRASKGFGNFAGTSGYSGNFMVFRYVVEDGQKSARLDCSSAFSLSGIVRYDSEYSDDVVAVTLPVPGAAGSLGRNSAIVIDTAPPWVTDVTALERDGTYGPGAVLQLQVVFSAPVVLYYAEWNYSAATASSSNDADFAGSGLSLLLDVSGAADANATYVSGSGTARLVFEYAVEASHGSSDLDFTGTTALDGGDLRRLSTSPTALADRLLACKGCSGSLGANADIVIDADAARVILVTSSALNGIYGVGDVLPIEVIFDAAVAVHGAPTLRLNSGAEAHAAYSYGGGDIDAAGSGGGGSGGVSSSGSSFLTFLYTVSEGDATADLDYADDEALELPAGADVFQGYDNVLVRRPMLLLLAAPGAAGSLAWSKDIKIDTRPAAVLSVDSRKPNAEYGAGEEILIDVHFTRRVVFVGDAFLLLETGGGGASPGRARAPYEAGNGTGTISFLYTVGRGEYSDDLAYAGAAALVGRFLAAALRPSQRAETVLPLPGATGSLDFAKDIRIDTSRPYVTEVTSLREGVASAGQFVDFQVLFNKPVNVTGIPRVRILFDSASANESGDPARYAYYDPEWQASHGGNGGYISSFGVYDGGFSGYAAGFGGSGGIFSLAFTYTVQREDMASAFTYTGVDALELYENATIRRSSTNPETDALLGLPEEDSGSSGGARRRVVAASVVLNGLWHSDARDLQVTLLHAGRSCELLAGGYGGYGRQMELGVPPARRLMQDLGGAATGAAALGAVANSAYSHSAIGRSYAFAEPAGQNIAAASGASARQSSTAYGGAAARAADGGLDGRFSSGSTSHTASEFQPYWEVSLPVESPLGLARIFGGQPEDARPEIQVVSVVALDGDAVLNGSFRLSFTDAEGRVNTTGSISFDAVASVSEERYNATGTGYGRGESFQALLEALPGLSAVTVTRGGAISSDGGVGSGGGGGDGYGRSWTITFATAAGDVKQLRVAEDLYYGGSHRLRVTTLQNGARVGGIQYDGLIYETHATYAPSWLLVLNSSEAGRDLTLEEARAAAVYQHYIAEASRELDVFFPEGTWGQAVRVQLVGTGALSLAELQLYEESPPSLASYAGATTVPSRPLWNPLLPASSLSEAFMGQELFGQWILRVADSTAAELTTGAGAAAEEEEHGSGGIGSWTLLLLDDAGVLHRFSTDVFASVETLPLHGTLKYSDGAAISSAAGLGRHLGNCWGEKLPHDGGWMWQDGVAASCSLAGPNLGTRSLGAVAMPNRVRDADGSGAWLWFQPDSGYLGVDSFLYSVTVAGTKSATATMAMVHTRKCRLRRRQSWLSLCACGSASLGADRGERVSCRAALAAACPAVGLFGGSLHGLNNSSSSSGSSGASSTNSSFSADLGSFGEGDTAASAASVTQQQLTVRSCQACRTASGSDGGVEVPASFAELTALCLVEVDAATDQLARLGYCSAGEHTLAEAIPLCDEDRFDGVAATNSPTGDDANGGFRLQHDWQTAALPLHAPAEPAALCGCPIGEHDCSCALRSVVFS